MVAHMRVVLIGCLPIIYIITCKAKVSLEG